MTPRLACPSDCIFLRKFTLLLFTFSWKCPLFWAFYFFYSSSYKYNCLVQDYGRVLYTLVSFSQLKGFLDVGHPLFFKFHEQMNIFYFPLPLCLNTYISSFMYKIFIFMIHIICSYVVRPPRNSVCLILSIGVNFLLHH